MYRRLEQLASARAGKVKEKPRSLKKKSSALHATEPGYGAVRLEASLALERPERELLWFAPVEAADAPYRLLAAKGLALPRPRNV